MAGAPAVGGGITRALVALVAVLLVADGLVAWRAAGRTSEPSRLPTAPVAADTLGFAEGSQLMFRSDERIDADLAGMRAAGARWVRFDLWWGAVEPSPGEDRWQDVDTVIRAAARHDLDVVVIPMHTPIWARQAGLGDGAPPADADAYARFVAAATRRLAPLGVHVWEIWNEPNTPGAWEPRPDPGAYAVLLQKAAAAIRAEDPLATVLFGGLAPGGDDRFEPAAFVSAVYRAGGRGSFDAMAVHPYGTKALDTSDASKVHDVMVRAGDGSKLIWGTEFGVPTSTDDRGVTEDAQARALVAAAGEWRALPWAGPLLVYMYRDIRLDPPDPDANFGVVRADGAHKAAFAALQRLTSGRPRQ